MNFRERASDFLIGRRPKGERRIIGIQLGLLLVISLLLNFGFEEMRAWERSAAQRHLISYFFSWDGYSWPIWLLAAPLMLKIIRRYPLEQDRNFRPNLGRIAFWCSLLFLVVANGRTLLRLVPNLWLPDESDLSIGWDDYSYNTFRLWPVDLLTFAVFFAVTLSLNYYAKYQKRAKRARYLLSRTGRLETNLARAELAALRSQLQPHFLFNSFNALTTLVRQRKNDAAVEAIAELSGLLRLAIDRSGLQQVPLRKEIDFVRHYLAIEHLRFGDKLQVDYAVDPATLDVMVPNIVLQPLVENAIKHGISQRTTPGRVRLAASRNKGRLHIEIADDGPDHAPDAMLGHKSPGIGLANTRAQLDNLYGTDYRLEIVKTPEGGTVVSLSLPWRTLLVS